MNKIEELESRIEKLECLLGVDHTPQTEEQAPLGFEFDITKQVDGPASFTKPSFSGVVVKKPVMYLYNFSGDTLNCNVDFRTNVIVDSVPEIRKDNKIVFALDSDSFINNKYSYLYYEFGLQGNEPKSSSYAFVRNDRNLDTDLERLARMIGLMNNEVTDFVTYWSLELKREETPFWKCEVFDESKLDKLFPLEITPTPNFLVRRYVKFVQADKLGKGNVTPELFRPKARTGALRIMEWGGWISGSKTVH